MSNEDKVLADITSRRSFIHAALAATAGAAVGVDISSNALAESGVGSENEKKE